MNAVGVCVLQLYRYGETVSIPFFTETWRHDSFYEKIQSNRSLGLHTLCFLALDGPFNPVTASYDISLRSNAVDIPHTDPRVRRRVKDFEPEQISASLSSTYDSIWISWVSGEFSNWG